jgi:hypothetical protein
LGNIVGTNKYSGAVLAPNGKIYCVPHLATEILEIDPTTNTTKLFGNFEGFNKYISGILAPTGKIYCAPYEETRILEISNVNIPNLIGSDAQIPTNLVDLQTSNYNKYYNKL